MIRSTALLTYIWDGVQQELSTVIWLVGSQLSLTARQTQISRDPLLSSPPLNVDQSRQLNGPESWLKYDRLLAPENHQTCKTAEADMYHCGTTTDSDCVTKIALCAVTSVTWILWPGHWSEEFQFSERQTGCHISWWDKVRWYLSPIKW